MAVAEGKTVRTVNAQSATRGGERRGAEFLLGSDRPLEHYEDCLAGRSALIHLGSGVSGAVGLIPTMAFHPSQHRGSPVAGSDASTFIEWLPNREPSPVEVDVLAGAGSGGRVAIYVVGRQPGLESGGTTTSVPAWKRSTARRLDDVLALPHDWDSSGSTAPTFGAAAEALNLLTWVLSDDAVGPSVVPLSDGGIQLEWHRRGTDVEIIVGPVQDRGVYVEDATGSWEGSVDESSDLAELVRRLREVAAAIDG